MSSFVWRSGLICFFFVTLAWVAFYLLPPEEMRSFWVRKEYLPFFVVGGILVFTTIIFSAFLDIFFEKHGQGQKVNVVLPRLTSYVPLPGTQSTLHLVACEQPLLPDIFKRIPSTYPLLPEEQQAIQAIVLDTPQTAYDALVRAEQGKSVWVQVYTSSTQEAIDIFLNFLQAHPVDATTPTRVQRVLGTVSTLSFESITY